MDGRKKLRIVQTADNLIYLLIVLSILSFSIETIPGLPDWAGELLRWFEIFSVGVFTIEYFIRIFTAGNRTDYIFSFYGLVDLLAILPFYVTSTIDLRAIRILRLMRLFRVFKLVRYSQAITRLKKAFSDRHKRGIGCLPVPDRISYLSVRCRHLLPRERRTTRELQINFSLSLVGDCDADDCWIRRCLSGNARGENIHLRDSDSWPRHHSGSIRAISGRFINR